MNERLDDIVSTLSVPNVSQYAFEVAKARAQAEIAVALERIAIALEETNKQNLEYYGIR